MPIIKVKNGYNVKSYNTGKLHTSSSGKTKVYATRKFAEMAAGRGYKMAEEKKAKKRR